MRSLLQYALYCMIVFDIIMACSILEIQIMCNLMKVQSSFRFKGGNYKVHFSKRNGQLIPVVKKMVGSVFGVKLWKETNASETLSNKEVQVLKECPTMKVVAFLRTFAQNTMGHNAHIV